MKKSKYERKIRNGVRAAAALLLLTVMVIVCGSKAQAAGRPGSDPLSDRRRKRELHADGRQCPFE